MQYYEIDGKCPFLEEFMSEERWVDIQGYEGYYQVSNYGRVKSLDRTIIHSDGRIRDYKGQILKPYNNDGYMYACLQINKKARPCKVHQLVLYNFLGIPVKGYEVDHIDNDSTNNRLDNLQFLTKQENCMKDAHRQNLSKSLKGKKLSPERREIMRGLLAEYRKERFKPILQITLDGVIVNRWESISQAGNTLGYDISSICKCCRGKKKTYKGSKWKYEE